MIVRHITDVLMPMTKAGRKRTSISLSLMISPVDCFPAGVGLSEVQLSHRAGAGAPADAEGESTGLEGTVVVSAGSATGMSSSASLSGDLVATSGSAMMVTGSMEGGVIGNVKVKQTIDWY